MGHRYSSVMGTGNIFAAEPDVVLTPHRTITTDDIPVILLHGATAPNQFCVHDRWASVRMAARLAMAGFPCIGGYMGGDVFANDTHMSRIDDARSEIAAQTGCSSTLAHLVGISMGAGGAVRYAGLNPSEVASVTGIIPMANIDTLYQGDVLGLQSEIGTAWGVVYPAALPAQANLLTHGAAIATAEIPTRFYYDDADAAIDPADVLDLAAAADAETFEIPPDLGHVELSIDACSTIGGTNWSGLTDWLLSI